MDDLAGILHDPAAMVPRLTADGKIQAIKELVDRLCQQEVVEDGLDFLQAVLERETLSSTVVGDGRVALPHARGRMVRRLGLALGHAPAPIAFPSGDERHQVDLVCLIAVPAQAPGLYLRLLGLLATLFSDAGLRHRLCRAETPQRMQQLLSQHLETTPTIPHHR